MLSSFPHTLKRFGLDADVRVLLDLYRTFELGLVSNLGSLHDVSRLLVCKSKRDFAPYTLAFWEHFLGIDVKAHRTLNEAVRNSPSASTRHRTRMSARVSGGTSTDTGRS